MQKIAFIGAGNMAGAMIRGMIRGGISAQQITAFDHSAQKVEALGVAPAQSIAQAIESAWFVFVAVKPKDVESVLKQLQTASGTIVSIAAGWTVEKIQNCLLPDQHVVRIMPNTPAQVGEAVFALAENHTAEAGEFEALCKLLESCGRTLVVPEKQMDAIIGMSGSGPAYIYMFLEAFADAGVRQGLPRTTAYTLAAQTMLGAAKMVLETGMHPGALKDAVCSPGGTTIEAVYALEKAGMRGAVMDAVDACARKAAEMAKK